jgi:hypothetical protein
MCQAEIGNRTVAHDDTSITDVNYLCQAHQSARIDQRRNRDEVRDKGLSLQGEKQKIVSAAFPVAMGAVQ